MSPTSYRTALSRDMAEEKGFEPLAPQCDLLHKNNEAPLTRLGYFSVYINKVINVTLYTKMVPKAGLEPARVLKLAGF